MKIKHNRLYILPVVFSGIALVLHGYLGYFSRYLADDFCTAFQAQRLGILRSTWFWYLNWSGRYSASILDAMIALPGPRLVPVVVPLVILVWLVVLVLFFLVILRRLENRFLASVALSMVTLFALFLLTPNVRQSLYWGQGMRSVVPPLILGTSQIVLFDQLRSKEWKKFQFGFWVILSFLWALAAGGFSETYAVFQVVALALFLAVLLVEEKFKFSKSSLFLASGLLGAIGALIIVMLAPGNAERQAFFASPPGISGILAISFRGYLTYAASLVNSLDKILALLGLFALATMIGAQLEHKIDSRLLIIIPCLIFGFTFICFPPAAYGTSDAPPERTLILPTYFFLIGLAGLGVVWGSTFPKEQSFPISKLWPALAMIAIAISASTNSMSLFQSRNEFTKYATIWDESNTRILKSKQEGKTPVYIPVVPNWASLDAPNDNPKFWLNACMTSYYHVQILAVPSSPPANP